MKFRILTATVALMAIFTLNACTASAQPPSDNDVDSETVLPGEDLPETELPEGVIPEEPSEEETPVIPETPAVPEPPVAPPVSPPETTPEEDKTPKSTEYIMCTYEGLNIRAGAGTSYKVLGQAEKGTLYPLVSVSNGWYKTTYRNGFAYLSANSQYTKKVTLGYSNEKTEEVISVAYNLLGTDYVYGAVRLHDGTGKLLSGFNKNKFDCSSLVQYAFYYGAKVNLGVNTRAQVVQGKFVSSKNLSRGDCIYFTNSTRKDYQGIERVGHVGIYLGNDYLLHTSSDYCKIEKMSATRWNYYIEARRFV